MKILFIVFQSISTVWLIASHAFGIVTQVNVSNSYNFTCDFTWLVLSSVWSYLGALGFSSKTNRPLLLVYLVPATLIFMSHLPIDFIIDQTAYNFLVSVYFPPIVAAVLTSICWSAKQLLDEGETVLFGK
ncbi:hypothetical protein HUO09_17385 [Vibrio sp. Y2-5]|uniref:hypothetical protein n=1 Tax=Vibrio sp. Y2-5 TaxID=2743977 RepID=UPI0016615987|nr:hypothetical protein [Vibrio sp. Y2-5]MBD0788130.1 hypothetical protein [Vibrio sp. Y2-5]